MQNCCANYWYILGRCYSRWFREISGGRAGDPPSIALAQRLRELKLPVGRLKQVHLHVLMHVQLISLL